MQPGNVRDPTGVGSKSPSSYGKHVTGEVDMVLQCWIGCFIVAIDDVGVKRLGEKGEIDTRTSKIYESTPFQYRAIRGLLVGKNW